MHAKYTAIDDSSQRQVIEYLAAIPPDICRAVFSLAFVVEAVHLGDLPRFVVASDKRDSIRVANFVREQEKEGLDGIKSAVDEIA